MKCDAIVQPLSERAVEVLGKKNKTVLIDLDYVEDYDEVIQRVEEKLWTEYDKPLHNDFDFVIVNSVDLCDELHG